MASYKIYGKTPTKKGIPLIFVIYHNGKTFKVKTGLHCKVWDQTQQKAVKDLKAPKINSKLNRASVILDELLEKDFDINRIRRALGGGGQKEEPVVEIGIPPKYLKRYEECTETGKKFFRLIEGLIEDHKNDWSAGYKKRFRTIRTKLLKFEPDFTPSMLTEKFWRKFVDHCIDKLGNTNNTISTDCSALVILISELRKDGYTFERNLEDKIVWRYIEPEVTGLSWDKVLKIADLDLTDYKSSTIRDAQTLWLIGAFTGRRWSEILTMTRGNFYQKGGKWRYRNIGKGQRNIDIPLLKEAVDLLTRIDFAIPKLDSKTVNADIKKICEEAGFKEEVLVITPIDKNRVLREKLPLFKTVTFHTSRHSYGQHIAEMAAGKPHAEKFVSFMLGHASFQTSWKYMNRVASSNDQMFEEIFS
ncbi:MAG TPA: tyrosine-type recombinase/integrase [Chitinophagaceae bacterium]